MEMLWSLLFQGVEIRKFECQDTNDLDKSLQLLASTDCQDHEHVSIVVLGGLGGCLSHEMGNINSLLKIRQKAVLVSNSNVVTRDAFACQQPSPNSTIGCINFTCW